MKRVGIILILIAVTWCVKETLPVDARLSWKPSFDASDSFKNSILQFNKEIQAISVEEFEKLEEGRSITDVLRKASAEATAMSSKIKEIMGKIPSDLKKLLVKEVKEDVTDFSKRWKEMNSKASETIKEASEKVATWKTALVSKIQELEKNGVKNQEKWDKTREGILTKLSELEKTLEEDLKTFKDRWTTFHSKIEHHMNHKPHHPTLQCGKCGEKLTLHQFMDMVKDRGYFLQEEDFWTDEELEEFYEGWGVWANRSAVHCPKCGSVNWKDVQFVSEQEEKEIEKHKEEL